MLSEAFVARRVKELLHRNHEIIICAITFNKTLFQQYFSENDKIEINLFSKSGAAWWLLRHPFSIFKKSKQDIWFQYVHSVIKKINPDIVHFEFSGLGAFYLPVIKKLAYPTMVSCHGTGEKLYLMLYEERKKDLKNLFSLVSSVHCVSNDLKQTILPYCNNPDKVFVNPSAVPVAYFTRTNPYLRNEKIKIISAGRLTYIKGYLTGLLAIRELKKQVKDFEWIIAGDGIQKKELHFYIHSLGLQNEVVLAGAMMSNEVKSLYEQADIFLLPSVSEGISTAALEAMSMELPVVSTACGGMPEVIKHLENGLLAPLFDYKMIAAHLYLLINNFELSRSIGMEGMKTVKSNYTLQKQTAIYEMEYQKLLSTKQL